MPLSLFGSFILVLCVFWSWSFTIFSRYFSSQSHDKVAVEEFKEERDTAEMQLRLLQEEMFSYQQQVASLLPDLPGKDFKGARGYPLRQLASTMPSADSSDLRERLSKAYLLRGKAQFRDNHLPEAIRILSDFIARYPYSPDIGEAYFLLSESYFRAHDFESATKWINKMVALFPSNELTGFALIRLGQIFEFERRPEEAVEVYQTVLRSFPQREVASQAAESIKSLEY
jgi:TolA-binding protein